MRYSIERPEGVHSKTNGLNHCNRPDCEWYYDGRCSRRAIKPRYVDPVLNGPWTTMGAERYILWMENEIREYREYRHHCRGCTFPENCPCETGVRLWKP
jgi:hypothetical protein